MAAPKKSIYLAGPITGLTHDEARYGWREEFAKIIEGMGLDHISCWSPMRGKGFLKDFGPLTSGDGYPDNAMSTPEGVTTRDFNDVKTCDVMIACFLESGGNLSAGTFMEYGFAWALQKPVIAVGAEDDPNIIHLMAKRVVGYRVDTLEEAALLAGHLLTPGI